MSLFQSGAFGAWRKSALVGAAAALLGAGAAHAALIVGVDDPLEPLWLIDTTNGTYTPVLSGFGGQGIANDSVNKTLYFMTNTVTLYSWAYGAGTAPQLIGNTTSASSNPFISLTGLGWDGQNGALIATRDLASSAGPEGVYNVDTGTAFASLIAEFPAPNSDWRFGAFDIDPVTGTAYGFSDGNNIGIYEIDLATGQPTFVAEAPLTQDVIEGDPIDIDGLAVGDGKIYLVEDRAVQANGRIFVYDIASGTYDDPILVPWFFNEVFAGATYIPDEDIPLFLVPEPSSLALMFAGGVIALRRRRSAA